MTTSSIKFLALIAMLIDHIGYYFYPFLGDFGDLARLIGRISFPLFIFAFAWGYFYSRGRRSENLTRLYFMGVGMAILNVIFWILTPFRTLNYYPQHNIFVNFLLIGLVISMVENWQNNRNKSITIFLVIAASTLIHFVILQAIGWNFEYFGRLLSGFLPSIFYLEYDFWFVIFGAAIYFARNHKFALASIMILFSGIHFLTTPIGSKFQQGFMIFSLIFMLLYNGKKGIESKWFFYIFYPLHIVILWAAFLAMT